MGNGAQKLPNKPMLPETMTQNCQELLKQAKNGPKDSGMALMAYNGLNSKHSSKKPTKPRIAKREDGIGIWEILPG